MVGWNVKDIDYELSKFGGWKDATSQLPILLYKFSDVE